MPGQQTNTESFEASLAQKNKIESKELRFTFSDKYEEKLKNALWTENSDFILKIQDLFERYKWDIKIAIREAFIQVKWSETLNNAVDELINTIAWENEVKEDSTDENYWKDSMYFPILNRLEEWWYINPEEKKEILNTKDEQVLKNNVISKINWLQNDDLKKTLLDLISPDIDPEKETEKITEETFKDSQFLKDFSTENEIRPEVSWFNILIANNYVSIPNKNWEKDKIADLKTSLDIIKGKIIDKESPDFKERNAQLISKIEKTTNIWEKYSLTKQLYNESLKDDWIKSTATNGNNSKISEKQNLEQNSLNLHFEKLRKLIAEHKESSYDKIHLQQSWKAVWQLEYNFTKLNIKLGEWFIPWWQQLMEKTRKELEKIEDPNNFNKQSIERLNELNKEIEEMLKNFSQ